MLIRFSAFALFRVLALGGLGTTLFATTALASLGTNWVSKSDSPMAAYPRNSAAINILPPEALPEPTLEGIEATDICRDKPAGLGIPGFQPGVHRNEVQRILGQPTGDLRGYWPNTRAVFYDLVPDRVSLGFLLDRQSGTVRQTEAAFSRSIGQGDILVTLNSMLGCQLTQEIKQGLEKVQTEQSKRYSFSIRSLKGVIERDKHDRIYIGIWERNWRK